MGKDLKGMRENAEEAKKRGTTVRTVIAAKHARKELHAITRYQVKGMNQAQAAEIRKRRQ